MAQMKLCISPLKSLYWQLKETDEEEKTRIAAVISTSGELPDPSKLRGISYICRQYRDIDVEGPGSFSVHDAACIAEFLRSLAPSVNVLILCCDAAISRSPAVAAAIARYLGQDDEKLVWKNPAYAPNMLVFRTLCQELRVPVDDEICDRLFYENRQAFKNAIKKKK